MDFLIIAFSVCIFAIVINKIRDGARENIANSKKQMRRLRHLLRNPEERAKYEAAEAEAKAKAEAEAAEKKAKEAQEKAEKEAREQLVLDAQRTQMEQTALLRELVSLLKKEG